MKEIQNMNIKQLLKNQRVRDRVGMIQQSSVCIMSFLKKSNDADGFVNSVENSKSKTIISKKISFFVDSGVI